MIYKYKAISKKGEKIKGYYEANNKSEVLNMLKDKSYLAISIKEDIKSKKRIYSFENKVKKKDFAIFCRQFYTMINAGISMVNSLKIIEKQTENQRLKRAINFVYQDIQKGYTLSQAMKKRNNIFPSILIHMVEAGEVSGTLDIILERMAIHFENENKLENKIRSAMTYPIILAVTSIIVTIFMLIAVLPTFVEVFSNDGIVLPWPTRFILNISLFLQKYWYIILGLYGSTIIAYIYYSKTITEGKNIDNLKINMTGIKTTYRKIITSRFTRTLAILISSGIPLLYALDIVGKAINNKEINDRLTKEIDSISQGINLSTAIMNVGIFPPMVEAMVSVGEESGSLDQMLYKTAEFYDTEVEDSLHRMITLVEPILLIFMALIIGFIVISITLPMFDMIYII